MGLPGLYESAQVHEQHPNGDYPLGECQVYIGRNDFRKDSAEKREAERAVLVFHDFLHGHAHVLHVVVLLVCFACFPFFDQLVAFIAQSMALVG